MKRSSTIAVIVLAVFILGLALSGVAAAAPGDLDAAFGAQGLALTGFGPGVDVVKAMTVQPDGKYVIVATHQPLVGVRVLTLTRFDTDGTLDATFGAGGLALTGVNRLPNGIAVGGGKIYVSCKSDATSVLCFNSDGTLDTSFATAGELNVTATDSLFGIQIAAKSNGELIVAGSRNNMVSGHDVEVSCYTTSGAPDASFGTGGSGTFNLASGSRDDVAGVLVESNGDIVVGGQLQREDAFLLRLTPDGVRDAGFGTNGLVVRHHNSGLYFSRIWERPDGKLIAGDNSYIFLMRFSSAGVLDTTYGTGGIVTLSSQGFWDNFETIGPLSLSMQTDGSIFWVGGMNSGFPTYKDILVMRFFADGTRDMLFGTGGKAVADLGGADDVVGSDVGPDDKLVVAGYQVISAAGPKACSGSRGALGADPATMGLARFDSSASPLLAGPRTQALKAVTVRAGAKATFRYKVTAATRKAKVELRIYKGSTLKSRIAVGSKDTGANLSTLWKCRLAKGKYVWKVYATDGNRKAAKVIGSKALVVK